MTSLTRVWKDLPPYQMPGLDAQLRGSSWAAESSCFYLKELGVMLDCGLPCTTIPEWIFITHPHGDHAYFLPKTLVDLGSVRPEIFVPEKARESIFRFIDSYYQMSTQNLKPKVHNKYTLTGVSSGDLLHRKIKNKDYLIKIFHCFHTVPTVAFGFSERRQKLKPELVGLPGPEIGRRKKEGEEIYYHLDLHHFCYIGDTSENVFHPEKNAKLTYTREDGSTYEDLEIFKYRTLIVECSFLEPDDAKQARKTRHMYWPKLEKVIKEHPENHFILYHFSRRYTSTEIKKFFQMYSYPNMKLWV